MGGFSGHALTESSTLVMGRLQDPSVMLMWFFEAFRMYVMGSQECVGLAFMTRTYQFLTKSNSIIYTITGLSATSVSSLNSKKCDLHI